MLTVTILIVSCFVIKFKTIFLSNVFLQSCEGKVLSEDAFHDTHEDALLKAQSVFNELPEDFPSIFQDENNPDFLKKIETAKSSYNKMNKKNEVGYGAYKSSKKHHNS